jgi:phosphatidylglycerophosphatase A
MKNFFLTLGLTKLPTTISQLIAAFIALCISLFILIYLDTNTLFLATILLSIIAIRAVNAYEENGGEHHSSSIVIDKFAGIGFAISVAPAFGVALQDVTNYSNGFLVQALLSLAFFIYFDKEKFSIIGKVSREAKGGIAVVGDDILAGFTAGIVSSLLWQSFLKIEHLLA